MMKVFNKQNYFEDLGDGWKRNCITKSVFYNEEEVVISCDSIREVLFQTVQRKKGFKVVEFLMYNLLWGDMDSRESKRAGCWSYSMLKSLNRTLKKYHWEIQIFKGRISRRTEWNLAYVDQ